LALAEAIERQWGEISPPKLQAFDALLLAMTYHRLERADEAKAWFARATRQLEAMGLTPDGPNRTVRSLHWTDRLELKLLRDEAALLLK
jgi:hypothetical protein